MAYRDPEKVREYMRAYRARNRERLLQKDREWNRANPEQKRARGMLASHGLRPEGWGAIWEAQHGLCYLCGEKLDLKRRDGQRVIIDHDHSCCPAGKSCRICRRGLAHNDCNVAIGMTYDSPARLRRIADALEAAQAIVDQRKADEATEQEFTLFALPAS